MSNGERESLRRIAYGPEATAPERAAAEKSLHELDARTLAVAADAQNAAALETQERAETVRANEKFVEHADSVDDGVADSGDEPVAPSLWNRSLRVGWLIPLVVGGLVLGVTVALSTTDAGGGDKGSTPRGAGATSAPQGTTPEFVITPPFPGHGPGNIDAANEWFATPATTEDGLPGGAGEIQDSLGIEQSDVRSIGHDAARQQNLWIARQGTDGFCMISVGGGAGPSWFSSCVTIEQFRVSGLGLSGPDFAAYWDGETISTSN